MSISMSISMSKSYVWMIILGWISLSLNPPISIFGVDCVERCSLTMSIRVKSTSSVDLVVLQANCDSSFIFGEQSFDYQLLDVKEI